MAKNTAKLSIFEIVWYSITGALALWGLTFLTFGVIVRNSKSDIDLAKANASWLNTMKTDFFTTGIITLVVGVIAAVIVLLIFAKTADREVEKQQRRAARLAAASAADNQNEEPAPAEETNVSIEVPTEE